MDDDLKDKTRQELRQIIKNLESTGLRNVRFPTKAEIEDWNYSLWEDKEGITNGLIDAKNYAQRMYGAAYVLWFMGNDVLDYSKVNAKKTK